MAINLTVIQQAQLFQKRYSSNVVSKLRSKRTLHISSGQRTVRGCNKVHSVINAKQSSNVCADQKHNGTPLALAPHSTSLIAHSLIVADIITIDTEASKHHNAVFEVKLQ